MAAEERGATETGAGGDAGGAGGADDRGGGDAAAAARAALAPEIEDLRGLLAAAGVCASHGVEHALAVLAHAARALRAAPPGEGPPGGAGGDEETAVLLAALLHDADDRKFFGAGAGYANARWAMRRRAPAVAALAEEMIALVSCARNGDRVPAGIAPWKLIPRYADRLEALGETGILRCFRYTRTLGRPLFDDATPRPRDEAALWAAATPERYAAYRGESCTMMDHYFDKLLRLGEFPAALRNPYLFAEAARLRGTMVAFVLDFARDAVDWAAVEAEAARVLG